MPKNRTRDSGVVVKCANHYTTIAQLSEQHASCYKKLFKPVLAKLGKKIDSEINVSRIQLTGEVKIKFATSTGTIITIKMVHKVHWIFLHQTDLRTLTTVDYIDFA